MLCNLIYIRTVVAVKEMLELLRRLLCTCSKTGANPTKQKFPAFTHICKIFLQIPMCKISYKFVKNEPYQIFTNICEPNLAYFTSILKKMAQNDYKKLPNYID
jgi:hypothetical protein